MAAYPDAVNGKIVHQTGVHCIKHLTTQIAGCDIRLIGDDNVEKARRPHLQQRCRDAWQDFKIIQADRSERFARANEGSVDDAVPIQEDGVATA